MLGSSVKAGKGSQPVPSPKRSPLWLIIALAAALLAGTVWFLRPSWIGRGEAKRSAAVKTKPACEVDSQCSKPKPYCDQSVGQCVACLVDYHCGRPGNCVDGRCSGVSCMPGRSCRADNQMVECNEQTGELVVVEDCKDGVCVEADGGALCERTVKRPDPSVACRPGLIDDMDESVDGRIPMCEGRIGSWYTFNDKAPGTTQTPTPGDVGVGIGRPYATPGVNERGRCIRTFGTCAPDYPGAVRWGAGVGIDLRNPGGGGMAKRPFRAAALGYRGIRFAAKVGDTPNRVESVTLRITDINTDPAGGRCSECYDDYGIVLQLTNRWAVHSVTWSELKRGGKGVPNLPFDPDGILSIQWRYYPGQTFDLYVDDVELIR